MEIKDVMDNVSNYLITDTDYENYAVVSNCISAGVPGRRIEKTYISTRERNWREENREEVDDIISRITTIGLDTESLRTRNQSDCHIWNPEIP